MGKRKREGGEGGDGRGREGTGGDGRGWEGGRAKSFRAPYAQKLDHRQPVSIALSVVHHAALAAEENSSQLRELVVRSAAPLFNMPGLF